MFQVLLSSLSQHDEVAVMLPHSWTKAACPPPRSLVSVSEKLEAEDILVGEAGPLWTLAPGGCGTRGHRVNMPRSFLSFNTSELGARAGRLARELTKLEFGVFEEAGLAGDPVYPDTYTTGRELITSVGCPEAGAGGFCPLEAEYNSFAPTKQNVLCRGQSAAAIIGDRQRSSNITESRNVTVSYVTRAVSRYVLVLDLAQEPRTWTRIKRALYRFISLLPEGATLSIVTATPETSAVTLFPTLVTEGRREGLHGLIPRRPELSRGCVSCAVDTASELLGAHAGNIVIVSTELVRAVDSGNKHRMFNILLDTDNSLEESQMIVYSARGAETSSLAEIFINIINTVEEEKLQKIFHAEHDLTSVEFSGNFYVEKHASTDVTVTLSIDDEQKVESFEVKDSTGKRNIFSKFEDGLVIIKMLGKSNPGMWSYQVRLYEDSIGADDRRERVPGIMVDVTTQSEGGSVTGSTMPSNIRENSQQVILAHVLQAARPVLGARVRALVTGPGGDTMELVMRDSGTGHPDIARGDGLYSAHVPVFSSEAGYHEVRISVSSGGETRVSELAEAETCCGSEMRAAREENIGTFARFYTPPSVFIGESNPLSLDLAPPSRVSDLRLLSTNTSSLLLQLQWSAPGGDLDSGKVSSYEIRCHTDPGLLTEESFGEKGILAQPVEQLVPQTYLRRQRANVSVPWTNQMFYYALVSRDEAGNVSPVSNLVSVLVPEVITSTETSSLAPSQLKLGGRTWLLNTSVIIAIAGGCGGVLLIIILVVIFMILKAKRRNKGKQTKDAIDTYEAGFYPDIKLSKPEQETGPANNEGVYNWLDGLQQNNSIKKEGGQVNRGGNKVLVNEGLDLCYEEGSSCSRPTTSTDDSLSNEEAEYVNSSRQQNNNNNMSSEIRQSTAGGAADMQHAALQLSRSRAYRESVKYSEQLRYQAQANPHRYGHAPGHGHQPGHPGPVRVACHPGVRKQRHESVV